MQRRRRHQRRSTTMSAGDGAPLIPSPSSLSTFHPIPEIIVTSSRYARHHPSRRYVSRTGPSSSSPRPSCTETSSFPTHLSYSYTANLRASSLLPFLCALSFFSSLTICCSTFASKQAFDSGNAITSPLSTEPNPFTSTLVTARTPFQPYLSVDSSTSPSPFQGTVP
jgi:hypothetical protein